MKTATHARFDEGMNDLDAEVPPNARLLRQLNHNFPTAPDTLDISPLDLSVSDDPIDCLDELMPAIVCEHPTLGFEVLKCQPYNTSASWIKNVRRKYLGAFIVSINENPIFTAESAIAALKAIASSDDKSFNIVFAPEKKSRWPIVVPNRLSNCRSINSAQSPQAEPSKGFV